MKYFVVPLFALVALFSSHAVAQDRNPLADRENRVPPVISYFQGQGIRFTSIGEAGGLKGYLAESATGHQQVFYITPDGKHAIAGVMIRMDGTMVTGIQLGEMRARFEAAAQAFGGKSGQEGDLSGEQVSEVLSGIEEKETEVEEFLGDNAANEEVSDAKDASDDIIPDVDNGAGVDQSAVLLPPAEGPAVGSVGNLSESWISKIDKDEFLNKAEHLPYFEVGSLSAPATLWMVADPQCPFCHKAWDEIKGDVLSRKLKVRVIMIAGLEGSDKIATDMLAHVRPARVWLDSQGGRNLELTVSPDSVEYKKAAEFLEKNMDFARSMGVDRTPFLAYVGKDGQFYSTLGLPNDMPSFLANSGL